MTSLNNRRPLKVRDIKLAKEFASFLSAKDITPNQISIFSIIFSAFAATFLVLSSSQNWCKKPNSKTKRKPTSQKQFWNWRICKIKHQPSNPNQFKI
jgi:hypothetical protein